MGKMRIAGRKKWQDSVGELVVVGGCGPHLARNGFL